MLLGIHIRDFLEQFKLFKFKDAGFVYESFRNETNQIFWDFWPYKSNPRYESFKNRSTKRIHNTNLSKTGLRNESAIRILKVWICKSGFASPPAWIRKDSFHAIVLRIREDSLDSWKQAESFKNRSTKRILKVWIRESGFASPPAWIRQSRYETNLFGVRIHDHDTKRIHGFAKRIHVFTNLLYDSRILMFNTYPNSQVEGISLLKLGG
jgi:hypothetical protein